MYLLISPALDLEDELIPIILEDNLQAEGWIYPTEDSPYITGTVRINPRTV
jgi:hypothetical protein